MKRFLIALFVALACVCDVPTAEAGCSGGNCRLVQRSREVVRHGAERTRKVLKRVTFLR